MEKSRLIQLLQTFSDAEVRGFRKFLRSPLFNKRDDLPEFFEILSKYLKSGRPVPEKEAVFEKLFPTEPFDDHRIRMLMSFLFQLAGQFLTLNEILEDKLEYEKRLSRIYRKRNLTTHFERTWNALSEKHARQPIRNASFFEEQYQISLEKYRSDSTRRNLPRKYLQLLDEKLDKSFLARKLWQACFLLSHQAIGGKDFDFGLLVKALEYVKEKELYDEPALSIYYYCYLALTRPNEPAYFQKFKSLIFEKGASFPTDELRDLHILAINFCIRKYNEGNSNYLREQFELYRNGFQNEYFTVEGFLSHITYQNAVTSALVMEEYKWAENFINSYRVKLKEEFQEGVYSFNMARLEYEKNNLNKALRLLQKAEYKDLHLNLAARSLQMKIYYEMDEYDLLDAHLRAFKIFLRRKKELGYHRDNYLNTVRLARKLLEVNQFDKKEKSDLKKEIESMNSVGEKDWLLGEL